MIYTHGFAGLVGGLLVGVFADAKIIEYFGVGTGKNATSNLPGFNGIIHGSGTLLKWQALTALWVILWNGIATFVILKLVGVLTALRVTPEAEQMGLDVTLHGESIHS